MEPEDIARLIDEDATGKVVILMKSGKNIVAKAAKRSKETGNGTIYALIDGKEFTSEISSGSIANTHKKKNPFSKFIRMTAPGASLVRDIEKYKRTPGFEQLAEHLKKTGDFHRTNYIITRVSRVLTMNPDNVVSIDGKPVDQWEG